MSERPGPYNIHSTFLRLRSDVSVEPLAVDGDFWPKLTRGEFGDFRNEFLVTSHAFDRDWPNWEMHPNGDEIVCLLNGVATFILELEGNSRAIELRESGDYLIVPRGVWHTARVGEPSRMLFITAGEGTQHGEAT